MRLLGFFLSMAAFALATSSARADWHEVRTDHFVLTIDTSEEDARAFATKLERFDRALQLLYGIKDTPDRRARPVRVYALSDALFAKTCRCGYVLAYYRRHSAGSFILTQYIPKLDQKSKTGSWSSQMLLLHEYSHHFMYANFPFAYPFWYSEGFAEFNANVSFEQDGALIVGYPANYRAEGLQNGSVSMKQLLEPESFGYPDNVDRLYGRGWLLTNYLMLGSQRRGQLSAYLSALNRGTRSYAAGREAFGDLDRLDDELNAYRRGKLAPPLRIPPGADPIHLTITRLSPGRAEMLPHYLLFTDGIASNYRMGPASSAAKVAERYPDDPVVQAQIAEIQFLAGRLDRAEAAADRALALQPNMVDAMVRKGLIAAKRAATARPADAKLWSAARGWYLKANRADPDAAMPLYLYYASFVAAKEKPTAGAVNGLMRAVVLAPESGEIRYALARQKLLDRHAADARALLQPIAFAPHIRRKRNIPREIVDLIDADKLDQAIALMTQREDDEGDD